MWVAVTELKLSRHDGHQLERNMENDDMETGLNYMIQVRGM